MRMQETEGGSPVASLETPFLRAIGLVLTYRCQAACAHCVIRAGPRRREAMSIEAACDWIRQAASYRDGQIRILSLTGGEPFLNLHQLESVATVAASVGLSVAVATNGFWAGELGEAIRLLRRLTAVHVLSISTDAYHLPYVPLEHVKNAIRAAQSCGRPYNVVLCTEDKEDEAYRRIYNALLDVTRAETIRTTLTHGSGRRGKVAESGKRRWRLTPPREACASAGAPLILPNGRIVACAGPIMGLACRHALMLGNVREEPLAEILDRAETNTILHALRLWGPQALIALLKENGFEACLPKRYVDGSLCDTCYQLMARNEVRDHLNEAALSFQLRRKVAYGRLYYLEETQMLERLVVDGDWRSGTTSAPDVGLVSPRSFSPRTTNTPHRN